VNPMRKALTGAAVIGLAVCTAAALSGAALAGAVQPALAAPSPIVHLPKKAAFLRPPALQLGAGIDLYTYPHQNFAQSAVTEVAYLKALHANAVTVSFPFFMHGKGASGVYAKVSTPTPAQLAVLAKTAEAAGLYVSLRPLLDETSLGVPRSSWAPHNPAAWFASYQSFLLPYATMAQQAGISALYVGAEFTKFGTSPYWNGLDKALRRVYRGTLQYADNGHKLGGGLGGKGVRATSDAYPDMPVPGNATVAQLTGDWETYDKVMPRGSVLSEVGIAGVADAYRKPWVHNWPHPKLNPQVQVRWFDAACHAAAATHMGGIYFWAIGFGKTELSTKLSVKNQAAWEVGAGEQEVASCFRQLTHG
jgi:hypothetical protein